MVLARFYMIADARIIIGEYLKDPSMTKEFACFLGHLDCQCYLLATGVRDVALVSPFWRTARHCKRYPMLKKVVMASGLQIKPMGCKMGSRGNKYWTYFIFSKTGRRKVEQIIRLRSRLSGDLKNAKERAIHRKIGKLFGYSDRAVLDQYPE